MKVRILLLLFLLTFLLANYVNAGKWGKLGVSRGIQFSSRGDSSPVGSFLSKLFRSSSRSSSKLNNRSSSGSHTTGSRHYEFGSSSDGHTKRSGLTGHESSSDEHMAGSSPFKHGSSSRRRTIESTPFGHAIEPLFPPYLGHTGSNLTGTISSQTSHQQNKDAPSTFLQTKGGDTPRLSSSSGQSS